MSSRGRGFSQKVKDYWKIVLIVLSIITIVVVAFTTDFRTFIFVLVALLLVVSLILLLTSGVCSDIKFFIKRFEHLPEDDRPIAPRFSGGPVGLAGPVTTLHAEMVETQRRIEKISGPQDRMFFHKLSGNLAKIEYNKMKLRKQIKGISSEELQPESIEQYEIIKKDFENANVKIERMITKLNGENIKRFYDQDRLNFQFEFKKKKEFSFLHTVIIEQSFDGKITIEAIFNKYQPFSLTLMRFESDDNERKEIKIPQLAKIYSIDYSHPRIFEQLLEEEKIIESLHSIHSVLNSFLIDKKYFLAVTAEIEKIPDVLHTLKTIYRRLISEEAGLIEVEKIRCYKCNEFLKISDRTCPNCGEKRPECGVCLLDLYPSETQEVVKTSCCGIYAHKYHLIMWLNKTEKCPNCRTRKPRWVKFLDS